MIVLLLNLNLCLFAGQKTIKILDPDKIIKKYGKETIKQLQQLEKPGTSSGLVQGMDKSLPESKYPHALMYRNMIIKSIGQKAWDDLNEIKKYRLKNYMLSPEYKRQKTILQEMLEKSLKGRAN